MGWSDDYGTFEDQLVQIDGAERFPGNEQGYLDWLNSYEDSDPNNNTYGNYKENLTYFADKLELLELYKQIHDSHSLQLLFDSAKDLSPEDLETVLIHIQGIRKAKGVRLMWTKSAINLKSSAIQTVYLFILVLI